MRNKEEFGLKSIGLLVEFIRQESIEFLKLHLINIADEEKEIEKVFSLKLD